MKKGLYSVLDTVAEEYGPLFEAVNENVAKRSFMQLSKKVHNPDDYVLCQFGIFDTDHGVIYPEYKTIEIREVESEKEHI
jgi:hypothetical protein